MVGFRLYTSKILPELKAGDSPVDGLAMVGFPAEVWTALGLVAAAGVLGTLHALASYAGNEVHAHETRLKVIRLRRQHFASLAADRKPTAPENWSDVEIVEDPAADAQPARRAA